MLLPDLAGEKNAETTLCASWYEKLTNPCDIQPCPPQLQPPIMRPEAMQHHDLFAFSHQQAQSFQYFARKFFRSNILAGLAQIKGPQVADCRDFRRSICVFF
jgi:hypothetical protein